MAEVAACAIGIASFGIQVCQGLLAYYADWHDYKSNFSSTYGSIEELSRTLILLKSSLNRQNLDKARVDQVKKCLESCTENLTQLSKSSGKLQEYHRPKGLRQISWAEVQRIWYPFKKRTLDKLQTNVSTAQQRLNLALQVLQLDVSAGSHEVLTGLEKSTARLTISVAQIAAQNQQLLDSQYSDDFLKIVKWLSPPDPWINHASARKAHDSQTGSWLVQSATFRKWKLGDIQNVWLHGKAGCGKTILCYTAIEDMRSRCQSDPNVGLAIFYFSFSDDRKQTLVDLLRSLVAQLGQKEPALSMLRQMSESMPDRSPSSEDFEKVLMASIQSYDQVFLFIDALDECPDHHKDREDVLEFFESLAHNASNIRVFSTSRHVDAISESMKTIRAETICIDTAAVNADIQMYVHNEMSRDRVLRRLNSKTQDLIEHTFAEKADGMFRWADCQLQELKKLKSTKPNYVQEALHSLPATLDDTYARMLRGIGEMYHAEALTLLQWLAYARSPLPLNELVEAAMINPLDEDCIDLDNVGEPEDALNILSGLVITEETESTLVDDPDALANRWANVSSSPGRLKIQTDLLDPPTPPRIRSSVVKVKLAHFSVKEFLESARIRSGDAALFHLDPGRSHSFLTQCCLAYLLHYSASEKKRSSPEDLNIFPLLRYAADSWFYHSALKQSDEVSYELAFLGNEDAVQDWDLVRSSDDSIIRRSFAVPLPAVAAIYYASLLGLHNVVEKLMVGKSTSYVQMDANTTAVQAVNSFCSPTQGVDAGHFYVCSANGGGVDISGARSHLDDALQAASSSGHERVVASLLSKGANVNAEAGECYSALLAAALHGHKNVVALLLDQGANVNAVDENCPYITALQAACSLGRRDIVELLLRRGADASLIGGAHGSALSTACFYGHLDLVPILLDNGADLNAPCSDQGPALCVAVGNGQYSVVKLLLDEGANVNSFGDQGPALQVAVCLGHEDLTSLILDKGADINASGLGGSALQIACKNADLRIAVLLLDRGADVNAQGPDGSALCIAARDGLTNLVRQLLERGAQGHRDDALQCAAHHGQVEVAELLLEHGANIHAQGPDLKGNALHRAASQGHMEVARLLLEHGADIEAQVAGNNALQRAARHGHLEAVKLLLKYGGEVNARSSEGNALYDASFMGHVEVARLLLEHGADLHKQSLEGTALHGASMGIHPDVVELLLGYGADVNSQGPKGSALQLASRTGMWSTWNIEGTLQVVKLLLEHGADINAEGPESSALEVVSAEGNTQVADLLLARGAKSNVKGSEDFKLQPTSADGQADLALYASTLDLSDSLLKRIIQ